MDSLAHRQVQVLCYFETARPHACPGTFDEDISGYPRNLRIDHHPDRLGVEVSRCTVQKSLPGKDWKRWASFLEMAQGAVTPVLVGPFLLRERTPLDLSNSFLSFTPYTVNQPPLYTVSIVCNVKPLWNVCGISQINPAWYINTADVVEPDSPIHLPNFSVYGLQTAETQPGGREIAAPCTDFGPLLNVF